MAMLELLNFLHFVGLAFELGSETRIDSPKEYPNKKVYILIYK